MSFLSFLEDLPDEINGVKNQVDQALDFPQQLAGLLTPISNAEGWFGDASSAFAGGIGGSIVNDISNVLSIVKGFVDAVLGAIQAILEVIAVVAQIVDGVVSVVEDIGSAIASVY